MSKPTINFELEGMDEIVAMMNKLGDLPKKFATVSAKDGAKIALVAAKLYASETGDDNLVKGIIMTGEKKPYASKKAYQIKMDKDMNDIFVKTWNGNRYYYPASYEFGFMKRDGKKQEGIHFMERALTMNNTQIETAILRKLLFELEKVTR